MHKIRIGMDFDGCINKIPFPWSWISRHLSYDFFLPEPLKHLLFRTMCLLPISLNPKLLEIPKDVELIVITGRTQPERIKKALEKYHLTVLARGKNQISELEWKYKACKQYRIDFFFDDRLVIIEGLRAKGIDAHDIKELIK